MNLQSPSTVPEVPGIDLEFWPRTYFLPPEFAVTHLTHIAGHERREMARALLASGDDDLPPEFLVESLDDGGPDQRARPQARGQHRVPELGRYYRHRLDAYLDEQCRERQAAIAEGDDAK